MKFRNKDIFVITSLIFFVLMMFFLFSFDCFNNSMKVKTDGIELIQFEKERLMKKSRTDCFLNKDNTLKENFNALEKQIAEDYFDNIRLPFSKYTSQEEQLKVWDKLDDETKVYIVVKSIHYNTKLPDKYIREVNNILKNNKKEEKEEIKKLTKKQRKERKELDEYIKRIEKEGKGFFFVDKDKSGHYKVFGSKKAGIWMISSILLTIVSAVFLNDKEEKEYYYVFKKGE